MLCPSDYCELNRRFVQFKHDAKSDDFALASYDSNFPYFKWGSVDWNDLLKNAGVTVVLGEPGSGRSYEFKARCQALKDSKTPAFYLELHRLVSASPTEILRDADARSLQQWQRSSHKGFFFLDAVDEAKLERISDFGQALENFAKAIGNGLSRATIFISSRISEWMPETDLRLVSETLSSNLPNDKVGHNRKQTKPPVIPVYAIAPMDRDQVARFAKELQVADAAQFLSALDEHHAWEFARRPWDVRFLASYWKTHQQIGSLTEMLEESLGMLLKEREERRERSAKFPLSQESARLGAEALAAASIFCRTLDFEVSDAISPNRKPGLPPLNCLPAGWTDIQCKALLDRPLFDSAMYGRVRFHHRRMAEYLAAYWLKRRMDNQCPPQVLHDLLFVMVGGRRILKPSRAPVAVWLACIAVGGWSSDLRLWLLEAAPHAFLRYGDPARLPIALRHKIIDAFVERFKDRKHVRIETDNSAMSRLADQELADGLTKHLLNPNVSEGVKAELLEFAIQGRVKGCLNAALDILRSSPNRSDLESTAIRLVEELDDSEALRQLAEITVKNHGLAKRHVGLLARTLFPSNLDLGGLRSLLVLHNTGSRRSSEIWQLKALFTQKSGDWRPVEVLHMLMGFVDTTTAEAEATPVSEPSWIKELTYPLLNAILSGDDIPADYVSSVARACWLIRQDYPDTSNFDSPNATTNLDEATRRFPRVRQEALWIALHHNRGQKKAQPQIDGFIAFYDELHFRVCDEDLGWLLDECLKGPDAIFRATVAWLAFDYLESRKHSRAKIQRLLDSISDLPELEQGIQKRIRAHRKFKLLWLWYWLEKKGTFNKRSWKRRWRSLKVLQLRLRDNWRLHKGIRHLRSGKYVGWLEKLTRETADSMNWAVSDWSKLIKKRGARITRATQAGCVAVWKSYEPDSIRKSDHVSCGLIVGLCGLKHLHDTGRLNPASLLPKDAVRAAKYAVNEMNGYSDWIAEIAQHHPEAVRAVLLECVEHEWNAEFKEGFWPKHLGTLQNKTSGLAHLVCGDVAALLDKGNPANDAVLTSALGLLLNHNGISCADLARIAEKRLSSTDPRNESYMTWLTVCLQVNPSPALAHLEKRAFDENEIWQDHPNDNFMVLLCHGLGERRASLPLLPNPRHLHPQHAARFMRLAYQCIDPSKDIRRPSGGSYSPTPRDDAQDYRDAVFASIARQTDTEAGAVLISLLNAPEFASQREWIRHLLEERAERVADDSSLRPQDIRDFESSNEATPQSSKDLFQIVLRRLQAIKHDVEDANESLRKIVRVGDREVDLRRFVARELGTRHNGKYTAPQETVIQNEERLDVRVENPAVRGPVVIEIKLADLNGRTINSMLDDLEHQLVERYLRDENSRHGVFLVGHTGERKEGWKDPMTGQLYPFDTVINILARRARELSSQNPAVEDLEVVGIDFRADRPIPSREG